MSSVIQKKKIGEVVEVFNNRRIPLSAHERKSLAKIYPYYGAQNIVDFVDDYLFDGEYILVAEDGENLRSKNQNICNLVDGKFWVNNHAHILKANSENNTKYLYYNFNKINFEPFITGSAQPKLNKENLLNIVTSVHHLEDQQKIASVLSALDSKIELNNRINAELEAMAKTLYDYWFVQFDFPDKNGKPYKSSGGKMVWNEELKREIPEGWEVQPLSAIANITTGKLDSNAEVLGAQYPFYTCASEPTTTDTFAFDDTAILIAGNNASGNFHVNRYKGKFNAYQRTYVVTAKCQSDLEYLYQVLKTETKSLKSQGKGSQTKFLTIGMLTGIKVFKNIGIIEAYNDIISPMYEKQEVIKSENQQLASLRDWLLPMLMNGQVTVGGAYAQTEDATEHLMVAEEKGAYGRKK